MIDFKQPEVTRINTVTDDSVAGMHILLDHLSPTKPGSLPRTLEDIARNMQRVIDSPLAEIYVIDDEVPFSTATRNFAPDLTGGESWVDDVVTLPGFEGKGFASAIMDEVEYKGVTDSGQIWLTTSDKRGVQGYYERRGYEIIDLPYRKTGLTPGMAKPEGVWSVPDSGLNDNDLEVLASIVGKDANASNLEQNIAMVLESATSEMLVKRSSLGKLVAASVINLCPILVGLKPWAKLYIDHGKQGGASTEDVRALMGGIERWVSGRHSYVNLMVEPPIGAEGYTRRNSALMRLTGQTHHQRLVAKAVSE